jgi:hypothetical protein
MRSRHEAVLMREVNGAAPVAAEDRGRQWKQKCLRSLLFALSLQYFSFIVAALSPMRCATDDGKQEDYMLSRPAELCAGWKQAIGGLSLVVYGIGAPVALGWTVRRNEQLPAFAQFMRPYCDHRRWWELALWIRRFLFLCVHVLLDGTRPGMRSVLEGIVVCSGLVLQAVFMPFRSMDENVCELVSLLLLLMNLVGSDVSRVPLSDTSAVGIVIVILNVVLVVYLVVRILSKSVFLRVLGRMLRRSFLRRSWDFVRHPNFQINILHPFLSSDESVSPESEVGVQLRGVND